MKINFNDMAELAKNTALNAWGTRDPAKLIEKLKEEVAELEDAWNDLDEEDASTKFDIIKELGDVLFCVVRLADNMSVSLQDALAMSIVKIQEREKYGVMTKNRPPIKL